MVSVTPIRIAWELRQAGQPVTYIAARVGVHRSTIYRWLKGIRQWGIKGYLRHYRNAKRGRRRLKTHGYIAQRVLAIRRQHHECCGAKIVYMLVWSAGGLQGFDWVWLGLGLLLDITKWDQVGQSSRQGLYGSQPTAVAPDASGAPKE